MTIKPLITEFLNWLKTSYTSTVSGTPRKWCLLGHTKKLNQDEFRKYFDRTSLNEDYVKKYNDNTHTKQPVAFIQAEINLIYGFHKNFTERHKGRLQFYRDDCAMKHYHTWNSVNIGFGKFLAAKAIVENEGVSGGFPNGASDTANV